MRNSPCKWRIVKNTKNVLKLCLTFLNSTTCDKLYDLAWSMQISFFKIS